MLAWLELVAQHWPTAGLCLAVILGMFLFARYIRAIEMQDMRARIDYLDKQVRALRYRDECYMGFISIDQEWHYRATLQAAAEGRILERHISFLEYRDQWLRDRGLEQEQEELWQ